MYSLFSDPPKKLGGSIQLPRFHDVEKATIRDIEKITDYYRYGSFAVKTNHILVRLILSMNLPLSYDASQYYGLATQRALYVATSLGMTSSISKGRLHPGLFYYGCPEILIAYTDLERPFAMETYWKELSPVKVLNHPLSNMGYTIPDGVERNTETGLVSIAIDIPELMMQYRGFRLEQRVRAEEGSDESLGIHHFVYRYVLTSMLKSQTDLTIFNRLYNLYDGAPMGECIKRHPFHITDYRDLLDRQLEEVSQRLSKLALPYGNVLEQIPRIYSDRPFSVPDMAETRQVWWALFLSRYKVIDYLWSICGEKGRSLNGTLINQLKLDVKSFRIENTWKAMLPPEMATDVQYNLKKFENV